MSEWIPCKDRLPETNIFRNDPYIEDWYISEPVLVFCEEPSFISKCRIFSAYYNRIEGDTIINAWYEAFSDDTVYPVAWMPLPPNYTG